MDADQGVGWNLQPDPDSQQHGLVFTSSSGLAVPLRKDRADFPDPALKPALLEPDRSRPFQQISLNVHFQLGTR